MNPNRLTASYTVSTGYNRGFKWFKDNSTWFIGYINNNGNLLKENEAINYFKDLNTLEEIKHALDFCSGTYSLILKRGNKVFLLSDPTRFFPVFYTQHKNSCYISDNFHELIQFQKSKEFDKLGVYSYLSAEFTMGNTTLVNNISQVCPGELVEMENGKINKTMLLPLVYPDYKTSDPENTKSILDKAGGQLAQSLGSRQVLLPLSGGYDSRLIACWLKKHDINAVCFTYGAKGTPDVNISEKVAKKLGFEWHYIEYTPDLINNFPNDEYFEEYCQYASRGTSMFYMQEYFALRELFKLDVIDKNFVAIPGHSGDLLGGSQLIKVIPVKSKISGLEKKIFMQLVNKHSTELNFKQAAIQQIKNDLINYRNKPICPNADYSIFEEWLIRERIAKFIFNSSHIFTFWGGQVRFPFWNKELLNHWLKLPVKARMHNALFNKTLEDKFFAPMNVNFSQKLYPNKWDLRIFQVKNRLRPFLQKSIKQRFLQKNDWVLYQHVSEELKPHNETPINLQANSSSSYHPALLNWYLALLKKKYKIKS